MRARRRDRDDGAPTVVAGQPMLQCFRVNSKSSRCFVRGGVQHGTTMYKGLFHLKPPVLQLRRLIEAIVICIRGAESI